MSSSKVVSRPISEFAMFNRHKCFVTVCARKDIVKAMRLSSYANHVIINITDPHFENDVFIDDFGMVTPQVPADLTLRFDDIEEGEDVYYQGRKLKVMEDRQAAHVARMVRNIEFPIHLIVCCDGGISRSAGVMAGILQGTGNDDSWLYTFKCPNETCARLVRKHLEISERSSDEDMNESNYNFTAVKLPNRNWCVISEYTGVVAVFADKQDAMDVCEEQDRFIFNNYSWSSERMCWVSKSGNTELRMNDRNTRWTAVDVETGTSDESDFPTSAVSGLVTKIERADVR